MNSLLLKNILPKICVQIFALIIAFRITLTGDGITACFCRHMAVYVNSKKLLKVLYFEFFASAACLFSFWFFKGPNIFHISLFLGSQHMLVVEKMLIVVFAIFYSCIPEGHPNICMCISNMLMKKFMKQQPIFCCSNSHKMPISGRNQGMLSS